MTSNQSFNLLEGRYKVDVAMPLILSCFNEQLLFFNRELLRCKIYGGDTREVETEIENLETKRNLILDYLKSNKVDDRNSFLVKGTIEIRFKL